MQDASTVDELAQTKECKFCLQDVSANALTCYHCKNWLDSKACKVCHQDIKATAPKCCYCQSWQDWRHIFAGGLLTMVSLAIAVLLLLIAIIK